MNTNDDAVQHSSMWARLSQETPGAEATLRYALGVLVGLAVFFLNPMRHSAEMRLMSGWNAGLITALVIPWWTIWRADAVMTRTRARTADPGNVGILVVTLLVSIVSLLAAFYVFAVKTPERTMMSEAFIILEVVVCILAGWALLQTAFTLHYARMYYSSGESREGLEFPSGPPDDLDFAYFAFGVGVAFQTSDVNITSRSFRRTVLVHSVVSFVFNVAIFALMVNLLAGQFG